MAPPEPMRQTSQPLNAKAKNGFSEAALPGWELTEISATQYQLATSNPEHMTSAALATVLAKLTNQGAVVTEIRGCVGLGLTNCPLVVGFLKD